MMMGFREVNDTTAGWTRNDTVPDFEQHGRHGIESMESLDPLPPGGEAGHAKRSAWKELQSAARYAKQFMIDEQDLIGDRLGLLKDTPFAMGRAAGRLRPDLVYGLLLANPTMNRTQRAAFHTQDGTLLSGAALGSASLSTAIASLMKQKDGDATLNLNPTHLLVGAELADAAIQLTGLCICQTTAVRVLKTIGTLWHDRSERCSLEQRRGAPIHQGSANWLVHGLVPGFD